MSRNRTGTSWIAAALATGLLFAAGQAAAEFSIDHYVIAGGGIIESTGGDWTLSGTIGQWEATEARALSGGQWRLTGGFWGFSLEELADFLFRDRFEANNQTEGNSVELYPSS